jgi:hypothetical protein
MMTVILAVALTAQTPATHAGPKTDAELRALNAEINARVAKQAAQRRRDNVRKATAELAAAPVAKPAPAAKTESAGGKTWRESQNYAASIVPMDRKAVLRRQVAAMERAQAEAARQYQIESQKQYERMLPYMLENQRQQLNRQSEMERNAIAQENAETYRRSMMNLQWQLMQNRPR